MLSLEKRLKKLEKLHRIKNIIFRDIPPSYQIFAHQVWNSAYQLYDGKNKRKSLCYAYANSQLIKYVKNIGGKYNEG